MDTFLSIQRFVRNQFVIALSNFSAASWHAIDSISHQHQIKYEFHLVHLPILIAQLSVKRDSAFPLLGRKNSELFTLTAYFSETEKNKEKPL